MGRLILATALTLAAFGTAAPVEAAICWVDNIYNNTNETWYFSSIDSRNNGVLTRDGESQELGGGGWVAVKPGHYKADWFGIPWYFNGKHYKSVTADSGKQKVLNFYTSEDLGKNWLVFEDSKTGRRIARLQIPSSDVRCNLRIEPDKGMVLDIVNNQWSTQATVQQAWEEGKWVATTYIEYLKAVGEIAGAVLP